MWRLLLVFTFVIATPCFAKNSEIELPLKHALLSQLISDQLMVNKNKTLRLADDGSGCQYLELSKLSTKTKGQHLNARATAYARLGQAWGGQCMLLWEWRGQVDIVSQLMIAGNGTQIKAKIVETKLLTPQGRVDDVNNTLWQWLATFLTPAFENMAIDIRQPLDAAKEIVAHNLVAVDQKMVQSAINSVKLKRINTSANGVVVRLSVQLPPQQPSQPAHRLTADEVAQLEQRMRQLDGFITFIVKNMARDTANINLKGDLLSVLLETRAELLSLAVSGQTLFDGDPVKRIFIDTWGKLMPVMRAIAEEQVNAKAAMNYLSLISATEMLSLLDQLGPHVGLDISIDGLRRLARVLVQQTRVDPIAYTDDVDIELRKVFGFGEAIKPEALPPGSLLDYFIKPAWAGVDPSVVKKLNNSLLNRKELKTYLSQVDLVLDYAATQLIKEKGVAPEFQTVFYDAVKATAWQETCWRQYVNEKGMRVPLKSKQGDLGMMQVNPRVWRGFYSVHDIKWDIVYNAKAGTEILYHYFNDYAVRKQEHKVTGKLDNLARASYSAYNGGPKSITRYRNEKASPKLKKVDAMFYEKYQKIKVNGYQSVIGCY